MNWLKPAATTLGVVTIILAETSGAKATVIASGERIVFDEGRVAFDTSEVAVDYPVDTGNGSQVFPEGTSRVFDPDVASDKAIDGIVRIDATNIDYDFRQRDGQTREEARAEAARS